jgi:hypothetical protein
MSNKIEQDESQLEIDKIFILVVSMFDDEPTNILASFTSKERGEKFVKIQKGINFPYKSYEFVESDLY